MTFGIPNIIFISTADGSEIGNICLEYEMRAATQSTAGYKSGKLCDLGVFSADNSMFIGYYKTQADQKAQWIRTYYTIDLLSMKMNSVTCENIDLESDDIVFGMHFDENENTLMVLKRDHGLTTLTLKKIFIDNGETIFEVDVEMEDNWIYLVDEENIGVHFAERRVYLYYGSKLRAFDMQTGESYGAYEFASDIINLTVSDNNDSFIAVLTRDGIQTLHTVMNRIIYVTDLLGSVCYNERICQAYSLNGGYLDLIDFDLEYGPDGKGAYISCRRNEHGIMAIVPEGAPNQILIEKFNIPIEMMEDSLPDCDLSEVSIDYYELECADILRLSVAANNIISAHMFANETYLVLVSDTEQIFVYDCRDEKMVFSVDYIPVYPELLEEYQEYRLCKPCAVYDDERNWLFIYMQDGCGDGIMIDTESWMRIATIPQMSGYCSKTGEIVISKGGNDRDGVLMEQIKYALPVYDIPALIEKGKDIVSLD